MCFSASASIGAGIVLSGVGIAALKKVQEPHQYPFASIPLIFALQQFTEGVVWLSLSNPDFEQYQRITPYLYLIFAQAVWPIWIPYAFMMFEYNLPRKKIMRWMTGIGAVVSALMMYNVFSQNAVAEIREYHIYYNLSTPAYYLIFPGFLYFIVIVAPPFLSTVKRTKWLAWSSMVSFLISIIYFKEYLISGWCFFAAINSVIVLTIMYRDTSIKQPKHV